MRRHPPSIDREFICNQCGQRVTAKVHHVPRLHRDPVVWSLVILCLSGIVLLAVSR